MEIHFVLLLITFCILTATSADQVRSRRDLARIQNIIQWLLGINEKKITTIQTVPVIENSKKVYTMPYENLLLRALPQMEINSNINHVVTQGLYPPKTYLPVQTIQNQYPVGFNSYYPPAMPEYIPLNNREYGIPMYPVNQVTTYKDSVPRLCQIGVINHEPCNYVNPAIITGTNQPLLQPPIQIQNRMSKIRLENRIPPVSLRKDIALPPTTLRQVAYMNMINEATATEEPIKKEEQNISMLLAQTPEVDVNTQTLMTPQTAIRKRVTFTSPVHSKYKYKMIYYNQPQKDTVVEMDSRSSQITKQEPTTLTAEESVPEVNTILPRTEEPPLTKTDSNSLQTPKSDNPIAAASENIPTVVLDDTPVTNKQEKRPKVIIKRRKLKSRPENDRGDIPDVVV